jgi:CBS domain-containing protein/anti-sigma regulatory factor (Ser/Thr protein kinase)
VRRGAVLMGQQQDVSSLQVKTYELKVADVMNRNLVTIGPDALMSDLREILRANRISGLPVVKGPRLLGIISIEDFIKALVYRDEQCTIKEKMTRNVVTVFEDVPLVHAIHKFETSNVGRFPVLERESGNLVGILTKGDIIHGLLRQYERHHLRQAGPSSRARHIFEEIEADQTTVQFEYGVEGKDFKRAGEASLRLKKTLGYLGIPQRIVRRLAIASYEAEMNLVIFTDGGRIRVRVDPTRVYVEVEDAGPGIAEVEEAMRPGFSTASDWVRELGFGAGMGLVNIKEMSDDFVIESEEGKGTLLKLTFFTDEEKDEAQ